MEGLEKPWLVLQQYSNKHEIFLFNRTLPEKKFIDNLKINFMKLDKLPSG